MKYSWEEKFDSKMIVRKIEYDRIKNETVIQTAVGQGGKLVDILGAMQVSFSQIRTPPGTECQYSLRDTQHADISGLLFEQDMISEALLREMSLSLRTRRDERGGEHAL